MLYQAELRPDTWMRHLQVSRAPVKGLGDAWSLFWRYSARRSARSLKILVMHFVSGLDP